MSIEQRSPPARQRPRFGRIPKAVEYGGISRSTLYNWAALHPELFVKNGVATLVNFDVYDRLLDELPTAKIVRTKLVGDAA
jgi:hypothetical protein